MKAILYRHTTQIVASKTAAQIAELLGQAGATRINTTYENGKAVGIDFSVTLDGMNMSFRLPIYPEKVLDAMRADGKKRRRSIHGAGSERIAEQAERTAWRVALEWLRAQLAYMASGQVQAQEVFLPYLVTPNGETLYKSLERRQFAGLLTSGAEGRSAK